MFYSTEILTKKGPLGRVWLAATIGKERIQKKFALDVCISSLCAEVLRPPTPYALRLSAQLMIGICRIFEKKCSIVFVSANDTIYQLSRLDSGSKKTIDITAESTAGQINLGKGASNFENITLTSSRTMPYPPDIGRLLQSVESNIQFLGHEQLLQNLLTGTRPDAILFEEELLNMTMGSSLESQKFTELRKRSDNVPDMEEIPRTSNSFAGDSEHSDIHRMRSFSFLQANPNDITLKTDDFESSLEHSEASHLSMSCLWDDDLHQNINMSMWSPPSGITAQPLLGHSSFISVGNNEKMQLSEKDDIPVENAIPSMTNQGNLGVTSEKERLKRQSQFRRDVKTELTTRHLKACLNNTKDTIISLAQEKQHTLEEEEKITTTTLSMFLDLCDVTLLRPPPNMRFFHFETYLPQSSYRRGEKRHASETYSDSAVLRADLHISTDEPEVLRLDRSSTTAKRKKVSVSTVDTFYTDTRSLHSATSIDELVPETYLPVEEEYSTVPTRTSLTGVETVTTLPITAESQAIQQSVLEDPLTSAAFNILQRDYFSESNAVTFQQIAKGGTRSSAAKIFYYILVLKTFNKIQVEQASPFGNIVLSPVS